MHRLLLILLLGLGSRGSTAMEAHAETDSQLAEDGFLPAADLVNIRPLPNYRFVFMDMLSGRGDMVNKDMPR